MTQKYKTILGKRRLGEISNTLTYFRTLVNELIEGVKILINHPHHSIFIIILVQYFGYLGQYFQKVLEVYPTIIFFSMRI